MPIKASRLKAIWPWLVEARYAFLSLIVIGVALVISLRPHTTEPVIRMTGLVLQILGIGTVIWGISVTRALFGYPSFASKTKAWLGKFPLIRSNVALLTSNINTSFSFDKARVFVTPEKGANPTIEARLEALENNMPLIHERINQTQKEMDEEFEKVLVALKREEQTRQSEDRTIREKLEATGTGGFHISAIGASWLFVGVVLSTAAPEIAELLK